MSDRVLTIKETADYLKVHWQTVRKYIHEGKLPSSKVGKNIRVLESDVWRLVTRDKEKKKPNEIELRFVTTNRKGLEAKLIKLGAKVVYQGHVIDHWFVPTDIRSNLEKDEWYESGKGHGLRVREQDNGYSGRVTTTIEIKKLFIPHDHSVCIEEELDVKSYDDALRLLKLMDLKEFACLDKDRLVYKYRDYKIVIDDIRGFKTAVEIEVITSEDPKKVKPRLEKLAVELGLSKESGAVEKSVTYMFMQERSRF